MNRLLSANFIRLKKDKVFWFCIIFMFALGVLFSTTAREYISIDQSFYSFAPIIGFVGSAFCSLFIGTEYGDGTIRNKIVVGRSRASVYLSNLIVCTTAGIAMCVSYAISMLAIGVPRFGFFEMGALAALKLFGIALIMTVAFTSIYTFIAMICQNKALVAVICIVGFVALLFVASWFYSRLGEPEYYDNYVYMDNLGNVVTSIGGEPQPNPNYLTGVKREVYQFALDFLPTGQAMILTELSMTHIWQLPVYSLIIVISLTACGVVLFERKDLK